jgi:hypothetical protein
MCPERPGLLKNRLTASRPGRFSLARGRIRPPRTISAATIQSRRAQRLCSLRPSRSATGSLEPCGLASVTWLVRSRAGARLAALIAWRLPPLPRAAAAAPAVSIVAHHPLAAAEEAEEQQPQQQRQEEEAEAAVRQQEQHAKSDHKPSDPSHGCPPLSGCLVALSLPLSLALDCGATMKISRSDLGLQDYTVCRVTAYVDYRRKRGYRCAL